MSDEKDRSSAGVGRLIGGAVLPPERDLPIMEVFKGAIKAGAAMLPDPALVKVGAAMIPDKNTEETGHPPQGDYARPQNLAHALQRKQIAATLAAGMMTAAGKGHTIEEAVALFDKVHAALFPDRPAA